MSSKKDSVEKLAKALEKAVKPALHLSDKVTLHPNLPGSKSEWSNPLDTLGKEIGLTVKPNKTTTIKLGQKGDSVNLTVTKKF